MTKLGYIAWEDPHGYRLLQEAGVEDSNIGVGRWDRLVVSAPGNEILIPHLEHLGNSLQKLVGSLRELSAAASIKCLEGTSAFPDGLLLDEGFFGAAQFYASFLSDAGATAAARRGDNAGGKPTVITPQLWMECHRLRKLGLRAHHAQQALSNQGVKVSVSSVQRMYAIRTREELKSFMPLRAQMCRRCGSVHDCGHPESIFPEFAGSTDPLPA